jgi:hypothetical protein
VVLTAADLIADPRHCAVALHGGDGGASMLLRLALDALFLQRPAVDSRVMAVALKVAVGEFLPRLP